MLIFRLLAPLLLAVLAWWGLRRLKNRYSLTNSQFRWLVAITAILLVVSILIVMGRLPVQALLAPVVFLFSFFLRNIPLLLRLLPLLRLGQQKWGNRNWGRGGAGASSVSTAWLAMTLDHQSGSMDGEVLQGQFQQQRLSSLSLQQLLALAQECQQDPDSLQLLQAYLDRTHPDWRDAAGGSDNTSDQTHERAKRRSGSDPEMTEALALEILGLSPGASREEIIAAHRRLMQKLHPDRGGSDYLAQRINAARDFLLG